MVVFLRRRDIARDPLIPISFLTYDRLIYRLIPSYVIISPNALMPHIFFRKAQASFTPYYL